MGGPYLDVDLPESFMLQVPEPDAEWFTRAVFRREAFGRAEDGTYACAGHGGLPIYIRCVARYDDHIEVVDGGGTHYTYRLLPYKPSR
jgi:hypothetical protein